MLTCVLSTTADKREFLRISQAVGMGFLIMGVIGYIVKLSKSRNPFSLCAGLLCCCCSPVFLYDEETERWWWSRERDFERRERRAGETRSSCILVRRANISSPSHSPHPRQQHPGRRRLSASSRDNRALLLGILGFGRRARHRMNGTLADCLSRCGAGVVSSRRTKWTKQATCKKRCPRNPALSQRRRTCMHERTQACKSKADG